MDGPVLNSEGLELMMRSQPDFGGVDETMHGATATCTVWRDGEPYTADADMADHWRDSIPWHTNGERLLRQAALKAAVVLAYGDLELPHD